MNLVLLKLNQGSNSWMTDSNLITENVLEIKDMAAIIIRITNFKTGSHGLSTWKMETKGLSGSSFFRRYSSFGGYAFPLLGSSSFFGRRIPFSSSFVRVCLTLLPLR